MGKIPEEAVKAALDTWLDHEFDGTLNYPRMRNAITAAKAAAQADCEARILSALEPTAARAQALEEALEVAKMELQAWIKCADENGLCVTSTPHVIEHIDIALAALSSPDHADAGKVEGDGWKPIESAPKDGTEVLAYQSGRYFKCWLAHDQYEGGYFWQDEEDSEPEPTHWRPLPSVPASEGASNV